MHPHDHSFSMNSRFTTGDNHPSMINKPPLSKEEETQFTAIAEFFDHYDEVIRLVADRSESNILFGLRDFFIHSLISAAVAPMHQPYPQPAGSYRPHGAPAPVSNMHAINLANFREHLAAVRAREEGIREQHKEAEYRTHGNPFDAHTFKKWIEQALVLNVSGLTKPEQTFQDILLHNPRVIERLNRMLPACQPFETKAKLVQEKLAHALEVQEAVRTRSGPIWDALNVEDLKNSNPELDALRDVLDQGPVG